MSFLSAAETASFLETFIPFLRGQFLRSFIDVDIHGIGVSGGNISGGGRAMEGDWSPGGVLLCDRGSKASLAEELVYFLVPSFGRSRDYFHPIDSV